MPKVDERPMSTKIDQMLLETWDGVAADWLALFPRKTCNGKAVQEAVADANRYRDYTRDKEVIAAWEAMSYEEQDKVLDRLFPPGRTYSY